MKFQSEIIINKPVREVFKYTLDIKNLSRWIDGFQKYKVVSGKARKPGSIGMHIYKDEGGELEVREEVLDIEMNKLISTRLSHKNMETTLNFRFLDQGNATKIIADTQVRLKPMIFNLAAPFVKSPMKKQQASDLERLKNCLERLKK